MFKSLVLAAAIGMAAVTFGGPAVAYEFKQGEGATVEIVGCDTLAQTQSIMNAWRDSGWSAYLAEKTRFNRIPNDDGQPSCGLVTGWMVPLKQYGEYNVVDWKGQEITTYLVQFKLPGDIELYTISPFRMVTGEPT